jgi:hypothetical protein
MKPAIKPILELEDLTMAKALLGHIGGPDPRMLAEMRRLRRQIRDLETELVRLQEENDVLSAEPATTCWSRFASKRAPKRLDLSDRRAWISRRRMSFTAVLTAVGYADRHAGLRRRGHSFRAKSRTERRSPWLY